MMRNNRGIEEPYLKIDSFIDSHVHLQHKKCSERFCHTRKN